MLWEAGRQGDIFLYGIALCSPSEACKCYVMWVSGLSRLKCFAEIY